MILPDRSDLPADLTHLSESMGRYRAPFQSSLDGLGGRFSRGYKVIVSPCLDDSVAQGRREDGPAWRPASPYAVGGMLTFFSHV